MNNVWLLSRLYIYNILEINSIQLHRPRRSRSPKPVTGQRSTVCLYGTATQRSSVFCCILLLYSKLDTHVTIFSFIRHQIDSNPMNLPNRIGFSYRIWATVRRRLTKRLHHRGVGSLQVYYTYACIMIYYTLISLYIILLLLRFSMSVRVFFLNYIYPLYKIEKKLTIITCWTKRIRATVVESYDPTTNRIHIIKPSIYTTDPLNRGRDAAATNATMTIDLFVTVCLWRRKKLFVCVCVCV